MYWGGPAWSENQSVSGVTTICLTQCNTSPSHRVDHWSLIVACGMLVHSSSIGVRSCLILAGTGTCCRIRRSRASQTCSMGDMSGEYAGHARTGMFSASRNCVQILATWGRALSLGVRRSDIQDRYRFDTGLFCWIGLSVWIDLSKFDIPHSYYCVIVKPHKSHKHIV